MGLLLIADALVVLMTAGLGFFYVGLLCDTYITNIMMMRVVPMGILPLTCVLSGFLWTLGTMVPQALSLSSATLSMACGWWFQMLQLHSCTWMS